MRSIGLAIVCAVTLAQPHLAHAAAVGRTIHAFSGTDGDVPQSELIQDTAGALYGTTAYGGAEIAACPAIPMQTGQAGIPAGCGLVYKLTPPSKGETAWTETVLHNFQGGTDGILPVSGLVADGAGNLYGVAGAGGGAADYCPGRANGASEVGCGVVFKLTRPALGKGAWTETVLFRFSGGNGAAPVGTLIIDKAGDLYGVTKEGGNAALCAAVAPAVDPGCGVVFKLARPAAGKTAWTETVLHAFGIGADGRFPFAGLTMDAAGNLYGTTTAGGGSAAQCPADSTLGMPAGCGIAFKLSPPAKAGDAWTETVLHRFKGMPHPASPDGKLALGKDGSLYGTSFAGGSGFNDAGTVFKLSPVAGQAGWAAQVLHNFGGSGDGIGPFAGPIFDSSGNLFGTTYLSVGGAGIVYELSPPAVGKTAWTEKVVYRFSTTQGIVPVSGLLLSKSGNFFGTTETGLAKGFTHGSVYKLTP